MPTDDILLECEEMMEKTTEHLKTEFRGIRTGRASTTLVEHLKVDYYGAPTDLRSIDVQGDSAARHDRDRFALVGAGLELPFSVEGGRRPASEERTAG